ncbi:hypothetical protein CLOM_g4307 [Closterium sp. NIES-68]|nr:hypothetical protein CLOM_g4307 [Closterium sp. NIES-68]
MALLLPECVVCVSEFDDDSAVPRVLTSCGHSLCATCIAALAAPWTLPSSASTSSAPPANALAPPSSPAPALPSASAPATSAPPAAAACSTSLIVRCPECSVRSRSANGRADGFPKNIELLRLLHAIRTSSRTQSAAASDGSTEQAECGIAVSSARLSSRFRGSSRRGSVRRGNLGLVSERDNSRTGDGSTPQTLPVGDNRGGSRYSRKQSEREWLLGRPAGSTSHGAPGEARDNKGAGDSNEGVVAASGSGEARITGGDDNEAGGLQEGLEGSATNEGGVGRRDESREELERPGLGGEGSALNGERLNLGGERSDLDCERSDLIGQRSGLGVESEMVLLHEVAAHRDNVTAVAVTSDSSLLFTASFDKTVRMWSLPEASLLHTLSGPAHRITALTLANSIAPRGTSSSGTAHDQLLVCGDYGGSFHAWDIADSLPSPPPPPPPPSAPPLLTPTHPRLPPTISSSLPSAPPLPAYPSFQIPSANTLRTSPRHPKPTPQPSTASVVTPIPAPRLVTTWSEEKDWRYSGVLSLAAPQPRDYDGCNDGAAGDCNEDVVYSGSGDRTVKAWAPNADGSFALLALMEGHTAPVSSIQVDSQVVVSGSWDGTVRLWWRPDHSPMAVLVCSSPTFSTSAFRSSMGVGQGPGMGGVGVSVSGGVGVSVSVRAVVVDEEGDLILCAREDGRVEVWHGSSSLMLLTPDHATPVPATAGNTSSTAATTNTTTTASSSTPSAVATADPCSSLPALLALAVCRPLLAAGAADGSILLWHLHGHGADVSITPWRRLMHAHAQSHIQGPCTALAFAAAAVAAAVGCDTGSATDHGSSGWGDQIAGLLLLSGGFDGRLSVWEGKI